MKTPAPRENRPLQIVLWGINYAPEPVGIGPYNRDLAEFLADRGHDVTVVTAFPYYPQWRKDPGDRGRWQRSEMIGRVRVLRCWCYVPAVAMKLKRILHELSFGLVSALRLLARPRADVYLVVSPPLGLGLFAWIVATLKRSRFVFHVQDLQPDAAMELGMIRGGWFMRALFALERLAYAKAAAVSAISPGMMEAFRGKGVPVEKCVLLPNWVRPPPAPRRPGPTRAEAREHFGIAEGTMLAVYAGNLGRKQRLEILLEAAGLLMAWPPGEGDRIRLIIAGDGAARPGLEQWLREFPRTGMLQLLPLLSETAYAALLRAADVALITQATGTGQVFLPSKLLSVLAAGLPVVAVADETSELARAVRAGGFGAVVPPGQPGALATLLQDLAASRAQRGAWAARTGWVEQFSRAAILPRFDAMLQNVARTRGGAPAAEPVVVAPA